jgi:hypothetical protein
MATPIRYGISFGAFAPLLRVMGLWKSNSFLEVDEIEVRSKMGWAFRATFPRSSVQSVQAYVGVPGGIGVHGFRGRWLVNGAASGIVSIELEPIAMARVMGFPVKLRRLSVSLDDPERFMGELGVQRS